MGISGRKDNDDSKKKSLQKAQDNGFGQKGVAGRPKRDATDLFNKHIESGRMEELVDKTFKAWQDGLESDNERLRVSTAEKFTKAFYNPEQKIVVEGPDRNEVHMNILLGQDNLTDKERAALQEFQKFLGDAASEETAEIEGEIVVEAQEEVDDEPAE